MPTTTQQVKQLRTTLIQFYQKPVARVSLELFMSIGAVIFFALFAIQPTLITMSDLIKEIEDKRALDQQLTQKIAALGSVQTQYLNLQNRLSLLEEAIPNQPEFETAIKIIEKAASDNRLVISSLNVPEIPKDSPEDTPFSEKTRVALPITVVAEGRYEVLKNFIETIRSNRRTFIVQSVKFSVSDDEGVRSLQASITVSMHYFGISPEEKAKPKASTNDAKLNEAIE